MRYKKVEEHPNLIRDTNSNAILNVDHNALQAYKKRKYINNSKNRQITDMQEDINNLKNDINTIKDLLVSLVDSQNIKKE